MTDQTPPLTTDHPGYFDKENPWEEGTVLLLLEPGRWHRVFEVNMEHNMLTIEYGGAGDKATMPFDSWNRDVEWAGAVTRVITPDSHLMRECESCAFGWKNEQSRQATECPPMDWVETNDRCPEWTPSASLWPEESQKAADNPTDEPEAVDQESGRSEQESEENADTATPTPDPCPLAPEPHLTDAQQRRIFSINVRIRQQKVWCTDHDEHVTAAKAGLAEATKERKGAREALQALKDELIGVVNDAEKGQGNLLDVADDVQAKREALLDHIVQVGESESLKIIAASDDNVLMAMIVDRFDEWNGSIRGAVHKAAEDRLQEIILHGEGPFGSAKREEAFSAIVAASDSDEVKAFELIAASDDDELMEMVIERADTEVKISANVVDAADKRLAEIMKKVEEEPQKDMRQHLLKSLLGATDKGRLAMIANSTDPVWLNLIADSEDPKVIALPEKVLEAANDRRNVLLAEATPPTEEEASDEARLKAKHEEWMKTPLSSLLDPGISASVIDSLKSCSPSIRTIKQWADHVAKQSGNDKPIEWGIKGVGEATVTKIENAVEASLARFNIKNQ